MKKYLLVLVVGSLFISCTRRVLADDLSLDQGKYYQRGNLFTGIATSYFNSGELEGEFVFEEGILKHTTHFGYAGETVGASEYITLPALSIIDFDPIRIVRVKSNEGTYYYNSLKIIVNADTIDTSCDTIISNINDILEGSGYLSMCSQPCKISVAKGEIEKEICGVLR
jgi:hypothetical protein